MSPVRDEASGSIRYPEWLTEDAPIPPDKRRSREPAERIDLLLEVLQELQQQDDDLIPIDVGKLFRLANGVIRSKESAREFSFIEFKAVVRCMVQDSTKPFVLVDGRLRKRSDVSTWHDLDDEESIVRQIRESMEAAYTDSM